MRVDAVWDIETEAWDTFVCGGLWTRDGGVNIFDSEDELGGALLSLPRGTVAWAHAGGRFDVLWFLDWCHRRARVPKARIHLSGSSVTSLAVTGGPILRDSARLIPMALKAACTMFPGRTQKERLDLPCTCGESCGGYCAITRGMARHLRARLKEYLSADILSLRDTLEDLLAYAAENDINLAGTVASTGWKTAKQQCGLPDADWELDDYQLARDGYYGGLVAVGQTEAPLVHRFDRKSAYPAALTLPVPCGAPRQHGSAGSKTAWARQLPGIYHATVRVPDMMAPPLPLRVAGRIVYPWGKVEGAWAREELAHAEEVGATVVKIHNSIVWPREESLLRPYVEHCFRLRERATSPALKTWLKFLANSPTGGFAMSPEQDTVALGDYADDPAYEPVGGGGYTWLWRRPMFRIAARAHVHWAATLTARARVELHRQIEHAGEDWVYSDTDSCFATRPLTRNIGAELGMWAPEGEATDFVALAPKVYSYITDEGKRHVRAKGIPAADKSWGAILRGSPVALNRGVDSLLVAARTDRLFRRRGGVRTVETRVDWCGARLRQGVRTRAPHVTELAKLPR